MPSVNTPELNTTPLFPAITGCMGAVACETTKRGTPSQKFTLVGQPKASAVVGLPTTVWHNLTLRPSERGRLQVEFARHTVWTVSPSGSVRQVTLLLKREPQTLPYSLTHAPLATLATRQGQRFFVERSLPDAKSEWGMADCQALT